MINNELKYLKALELIPGLGPFRISSLLKDFSKPSNIFLAKERELLSLKYIPKKILKQFQEKKKEVILRAEKEICKDIETGKKISASFTSLLDSDYPKHLREVENVSPPILYYKGSLDTIREQAIAIVGTRNPTPRAKELAYSVSRLFAEKGWTVVSGMASGIDRQAHLGALNAKGKTVAVLGGGVDRIYPKENADIYSEIVNQGCIISEYTFGTRPEPSNLKKRNRIIGALSKGIIVIEAPINSGAFNTVRFALDNDRPIFTPMLGKPSTLNKGNIKLVACKEAYELPENNLYEYIDDKIKNWFVNNEKLLPITKDKDFIVSLSQEDKGLWFLVELKKILFQKEVSKKGKSKQSDYLEWFDAFKSYIESSQDHQASEFFKTFLAKFHYQNVLSQDRQKLYNLLNQFINQWVERIAVEKFIKTNF